jgi:energy-coupling factor transport system ATP-binding protein
MNTKEFITVNGLTFTYPSRTIPTLKDIDLKIEQGEFVLITGPTGCGKSTLLKALNGIIPWQSSGTMEGNVVIAGLDTRKMDQSRLCQEVGLVFQSPDDQIFSTVIEDEIAFGLENLCVSRAEMHVRIAEALHIVGLDDLQLRSTTALSGGQKQRLVIAALIALRPCILALDEPLSQLDPVGAEEVLRVLRELNRKHGMTVVMVEHRVHEVADSVSRIVVMAEGRIELDTPISKAFSEIELFERFGLRVPETVELFVKLGLPQRPLNAAEALPLLQHRLAKPIVCPNYSASLPKKNGKPIVIEGRDLNFAYQAGHSKALENVNLTVHEGEAIALMGTNGSGKSTLLMHCCGALHQEFGNMVVLGRDLKKHSASDMAGDVGVVFQNPDLMLFENSVWSEVAFGPRNLGLTPKELEQRAEDALAAMIIGNLASDFPLALSRGQRLRTAVASILAMHPRIILLDEPTTGQDRVHIETMLDFITRGKNHSTLVFCTHDVLAAAKYADRIVAMSGGQVIADGPPRTILSDDTVLSRTSLKAPQSLVLSRALGVPSVFTVDELVEVLK